MATSTRKERLEKVIGPLVELSEFSHDEAKQVCREATQQMVTMTIKQLVRDGALDQFRVDRQMHFRWTEKPFEPQIWIGQQIHGTQVTAQPESDRPRERLLSHGAPGLSTGDLLAILIRVGVRGESAVAGGQKLANHFAKRIETLPAASLHELRAITPTVTRASYAQISAGIELGYRIAQREMTQPPRSIAITSTSQALEYCSHRFARLAQHGAQEEFHIVTPDTKHKPIETHQITVGTLDASLVHPREVFRPAIRDAASAILLVHNHPSGDPTPSSEDHQVTRQLTEAGKLLGIQVLDHIVVAREQSISIREVS